MQLLSQIDGRWSAHPLGSRGRPGTIGQFGCDLTVDTMVANDALAPALHFTPATLDELYVAKGIFTPEADGTYDMDPDNALALAFPGRFQATAYAGWRPDVVRAAIPTPDTYIKLWLAGWSPLWRMNIVTHFIMGWSADGTLIADPEGGIVRPLSAYGGPANVHRTIAIKHLRPAPAVVVVPKPAPAPVVVVPIPLYTVRAAGLAGAPAQKYDDAAAAAAAYARAHVGSVAEVVDVKGATVETEYVAPPPAPAPPVPVPQPTPPPPHAAPDFWSVLQSVLIQLLAPLFRGRAGAA